MSQGRLDQRLLARAGQGALGPFYPHLAAGHWLAERLVRDEQHEQQETPKQHGVRGRGRAAPLRSAHPSIFRDGAPPPLPLNERWVEHSLDRKLELGE